jgi:hypothetical protein
MEHLNPDTLNGITALTNNRIEIFGGSYSREMIIVAVMAILYFLGVLIACILKLNGKARALDVFLASILVFFLSSPVSIRLLNGDWAVSKIAVVDEIVKWVANSGPVPNAFFAFGVIMAFGLMSWPLFQLLLRVLRRILSVLDSKAKPPTGPDGAPV